MSLRTSSWRAAIAGLLVASCALPAWASQPLPVVRVSFATDRGSFQDGLARAAYAIECPAAIAAEDCPAPTATNDVDPARRTVQMAKLGFHVSRTVEAGPADAPSVESTHAAAPEQLTRVRFDIQAPGDYVVTVSGDATDEVDPQPVQGSASAGATFSGRSVKWVFDDAQPGTHELTVRFAPNAVPGFTGTFAPRVVVERTVETSRLLESALSFIPAQAKVTRVSTVTLRQHVAADFGYPWLRGEKFHAATGSDSLATSWDTTVSLDAFGIYQPELGDLGTVSASSKALFSDLVPKGSSANTFSMGAVYHQLFGQNKAEIIPGWVLFDETPVGFKLTVQTDSRSEEGSPLDGTLWDGDALVATAAGNAGTVLAEDRGPPVDDDGAIRPDWNGSTGRGWAALWANVVPGGEPNALNSDRIITQAYNAALPQYARPYGEALLTTAAVPIVAEGGDVDNRAGTDHRVGDPVTVELPPGQKVYASIVFHVSLSETRYDPVLTAQERSVTITPRVAPGGYWRRSTGSGLERRWANLELVSVTGTRDGGGAPPELASTFLVPQGLRGAADVFVRGLGWQRLRLGSGAWKVVAGAEGVSATRTMLAAR